MKGWLDYSKLPIFLKFNGTGTLLLHVCYSNLQELDSSARIAGKKGTGVITVLNVEKIQIGDRNVGCAGKKAIIKELVEG